MTAVNGFTGKHIKCILYIPEMTTIIYRPRLTYNMSVVYLLFCRTCVNIENTPTAGWICSNCIKIKSVKIEE